MQIKCLLNQLRKTAKSLPFPGPFVVHHDSGRLLWIHSSWDTASTLPTTPPNASFSTGHNRWLLYMQILRRYNSHATNSYLGSYFFTSFCVLCSLTEGFTLRRNSPLSLNFATEICIECTQFSHEKGTACVWVFLR
jgi:hypothetical protein